jgi:site-specific recombinase XerD
MGAVRRRSANRKRVLRANWLRHTFGTFLYNYKLDLFYVKNQLGHSSVNTAEIYAKTPESSKTEQMKGLEESLNN